MSETSGSVKDTDTDAAGAAAVAMTAAERARWAVQRARRAVQCAGGGGDGQPARASVCRSKRNAGRAAGGARSMRRSSCGDERWSGARGGRWREEPHAGMRR